MKKYEFNGNFLYSVKLMRKLYNNAIGEVADKFNISFSAADVLSFLYEYKEFDTAKDIANYKDMSKAYVSDAVYKLVKKDYLSIKVDKNDRRLQHLEITDSAKEIAEALQNAQQGFYKTIMSQLTDNEIKVLLTTIEKCAVGIQKETDRLKLECK